ncbi:CTLH/CRA C-terminal to lish motif domain-containing protein [Xylariaceae sp. FL0594]|nr:CTLH/CRA C-terminal to lish motif domain-containing protein [Xylariaceae sp. FL0594]
MSMLELQKELKKFSQGSKLTSAVEDVDRLIELLLNAREAVAEANEPHTNSLTLSKLQNPVAAQLEAINNDLARVHKSQNAFHKALTRAFKETKGTLPTENNPLGSQTALVNRAIAMHLLREGQFNVAATFIGEAQPQGNASRAASLSQERGGDVEREQRPLLDLNETDGPDASPDAMITDADIPADLTAFQSQALQERFTGMYAILSSLKNHDLQPAIQWARENSAELEGRGSNLEFELCKLQFIWLFKGPSVNGLPDGPDNGEAGAMKYGLQNFARFQPKHLPEIQRLTGAMAFSSWMAYTPYQSIFDISVAFDEVASSFTREFCSLIGLSAESPLYVAATAGALALPNLIKWTSIHKKNAEWATRNEMAFETPLPKSMFYHSIFVCPVSKGQTTDDNPPMILPCGHVLARDSLRGLAKGGSRYKCPYCPSEGIVKDAREIIL